MTRIKESVLLFISAWVILKLVFLAIILNGIGLAFPFSWSSWKSRPATPPGKAAWAEKNDPSALGFEDLADLDIEGYRIRSLISGNHLADVRLTNGSRHDLSEIILTLYYYDCVPGFFGPADEKETVEVVSKDLNESGGGIFPALKSKLPLKRSTLPPSAESFEFLWIQDFKIPVKDFQAGSTMDLPLDLGKLDGHSEREKFRKLGIGIKSARRKGSAR
ncbi:MAG: hypothetical protein VX768_00010 [Planctomycetota bacterium]|nr:hypothetical protein [Planctomycetota bacterium]